MSKRRTRIVVARDRYPVYTEVEQFRRLNAYKPSKNLNVSSEKPIKSYFLATNTVKQEIKRLLTQI